MNFIFIALALTFLGHFFPGHANQLIHSEQNDELKALSGMKKFKVITLLPLFEKVDQKMIYDAMTECFKKYGRVVTSDKKTGFQDLLELDTKDPICFFFDQQIRRPNRSFL